MSLGSKAISVEALVNCRVLRTDGRMGLRTDSSKGT
jgi:hypothetical protein